MTDDATEIAEDAVAQNEQASITVEIPLSEVHETIRTQLEGAGVSVDEQLATQLQRQAENTLHEMLQQGRYN